MRWLARLLARFRRKPAARALLSLSEREPADAPAPSSDLDLVSPPAPVVDAPLQTAEAAHETSPVEEIAFAPPEAYAAAAPVVELEEDVETRDFEEEADAEVDPFDGDDHDGPPLDVRLLQALDDVPANRVAARARALEGPHRVALTDAAGPGSLAEALVELEREGLVLCHIETDDAGEPYLGYTPIVLHGDNASVSSPFGRGGGEADGERPRNV